VLDLNPSPVYYVGLFELIPLNIVTLQNFVCYTFKWMWADSWLFNVQLSTLSFIIYLSICISTVTDWLKNL